MQARIILMIFFVSHLNTVLAQPAEKLLLTTDKQWYYPGEPIWLALNTFNACSGNPAQMSSVAYVELVDADARPVVQSKLKIEDAHGKGSMIIDDNFASGNYTLVAYTSWMKNFGAKIFARKPIRIINPAKPGKISASYTPPDERIETSTKPRFEISKSQFGKRELVALNISEGKRARLSVSAYRIDDLEKGSEKIYMSQVPDPCSLGSSDPAPFILERRGHVVTGKVIDLKTQLPAANINGFLSSVDYPDRLFMATSDSTGTIRFDVGDLTGKTEVVLQTDAASHDKYIIELVNPFAGNSNSASEKGTNDVFESNPEVIDEAIMSAQVQEIFSSQGRLTSVPDSTSEAPFYGKPDGFYLMSSYEHFSTVEEIFREYVANVGVKKRGDKLYPVVYDLKTQKPFREPPLILVNGVPMFDGDRLMKMNTNDFHSIAVVAVKFVIGTYTFHGIIDVRLNTSLKELDANARVMDYDGIEPKTEFLSPDYKNEIERFHRKPDFRNVLYWNPLVETDNDGNGKVEFYTSDLEGKYIVVVQSISRDGQVNTSKSLIEVK